MDGPGSNDCQGAVGRRRNAPTLAGIATVAVAMLVDTTYAGVIRDDRFDLDHLNWGATARVSGRDPHRNRSVGWREQHLFRGSRLVGARAHGWPLCRRRRRCPRDSGGRRRD